MALALLPVLVLLALPTGWLLHRAAWRLAAVEAAALPSAAIIQILSAAVAAWAALALPPELAAPACLLGWTLITLAAIDLGALILPDALTLPLAAAGLMLAEPDLLADHVAGALAGAAIFAGLARAYRRLRGRDGLGLGDAKLLAAAGAWVGWQGLASVVLLAASLGLAWALAQGACRRPLEPARRLPFGPFLCLGLWFTWTLGPIHVA